MGLLDRAAELKQERRMIDGEDQSDIAVLDKDDLVEIENGSAPVSDEGAPVDIPADISFDAVAETESLSSESEMSVMEGLDLEIPGLADIDSSDEEEKIPDFGVTPASADELNLEDEIKEPAHETIAEIDERSLLSEELPNSESLAADGEYSAGGDIRDTGARGDESFSESDTEIDDGVMRDLEDVSHVVPSIGGDDLDAMLDLDTVTDNAAISGELNAEKIIAAKEEDEIPGSGQTADEKTPKSIKETLSDLALPHDEGELSSVLWDSSAELLRAKNQQDLFNMLLLLVMGQVGANAVSILTPIKGEDNKWGIADTRGARLRSKMITFKGSDPIMSAALSGKRLVDIEEFAGTIECRDEYPLFNSISGRYILPMIADDRAGAVLAIGEKISGEEYLPQEKAFLLKIVETAGNLLSYINIIETLGAENRGFIARNKEYSDIEMLERDFRRSFIAESAAISIAEKMNYYGAECFAFFSRSERGNVFQVRFTEKEDLCSFRESGFTIPVESEFCSHLVQHDEWEEFEHPASSRVLRSVFSDAQILKMNICVVYPFVLRGYLAGFLVVMRARRERLDECRVHAMRLARTVFSIVQQRESILVEEGIFIDTISRVSERMERTVREAEALKIPVSFVSFSVKNIKRYVSLFGSDDAEKLMETFRSVVESRISGSEYALRIERGRIMTVLPGKSRKYAMPFATAVRNELVSHFSERESQILLSYLIAEYPADGKGLCEILEYLD